MGPGAILISAFCAEIRNADPEDLFVHLPHNLRRITMAVYTHQLKHWPGFVWDHEKIGPGLAAVRYQQGLLLGRMEGMVLPFQAGVQLDTLTLEVLRSGELDGQVLDAAGIRLSVARRLGMDKESPVLADPVIEGIVGIVADATQNYAAPVTNE